MCIQKQGRLARRLIREAHFLIREIQDNEQVPAAGRARERQHRVAAFRFTDPPERGSLVIILPQRGIFHIHVVQAAEISLKSRVDRALQSLPVQIDLFIPFPGPGELVPHEVQLLSRMREHVQIEQPGLLHPHVKIPVHLVDDRSLPVNDLVMGERQKIALVVEVFHREQQLADIPSALRRIFAHEFQCVVHPAEIPLVIESKAVLRDRSRCSQVGR